MGLHPSAISVVLLLLLELLHRGYRVCVSTHSPHVLDVVWALRTMQQHQAIPDDVLDLFGVRKSDPTKDIAKSALKKKFRVYYFGRDGISHDISNLDPGSNRDAESGWGGLTEFSARVTDLVGHVTAKSGSATRADNYCL